MNRDVSRRGLLGVGASTVALGIAGCLGSSSEDEWDVDGTLAVSNAQQFSSPDCGCCHRYASYLREHLDTTLEETETDDVAGLKRRHGVPAEAQSCHTLVLDEYVVEGHVPFEVIAQLLDERPSIDGIALPGMPSGSPGMGGTKADSFTVYELDDGKSGGVYAEI
ncbi:hypothetical protein G9C85_15170 [Halorubellus sp. JP-L1]|uniref:DUF411 domain-containing protein n=1 Tax=Halorubellus sp. JP-L1 TaxID=2715753 RepID=UPI00140D2DD4|nr:DUF411 domain-containing protein [Halorubellus sp. JP-L1]NHN42960.1 hypothetical protein [Halorubellus sp. JP-L1]